ncbi:hypothetical protein [Pseudoxanthomonas dokdonensis]|uniref:hypothetical protein n=1 Tax=Pseudoxanthomonas dokdonensis TaxID=344882 RepID=UPI003CCC01E5
MPLRWLFPTVLTAALAWPAALASASNASTSNATATATAAATATPANDDCDGCMQALLQRLGWRIDSQAERGQAMIQAGQPCQRDDLAQAQAAGDLRLSLPRGLTPAQRTRALQAALEDPATRCAYMFALAAATARATAALDANPGYRFTALQLGWIGFGWGGARAQGWQGFRSLGRGYQPAAGNARALDAFYHGRVRSECGVGRQIAQLATQRELYGDAAFDDEFSAGELSIGTFLTLHDTDSILLGAHAGEFFGDGKAVKSSRMGRHAFAGVPGFLVHAFDRITLDDVNNQAQNFVIVDVSPAAYASLHQHGGFAYFDQQNARIWTLARQLRDTGIRDFMPLLQSPAADARAGLESDQQQILARMDALLADPFYRGFRIYVHHRGVQPIAYHVVRMLDRNPRTPYTVSLARHNLHTTLYRRWRDRQLHDCRSGHALAGEPSHADAGR